MLSLLSIMLTGADLPQLTNADKHLIRLHRATRHTLRILKRRLSLPAKLQAAGVNVNLLPVSRPSNGCKEG